MWHVNALLLCYIEGKDWVNDSVACECFVTLLHRRERLSE